MIAARDVGEAAQRFERLTGRPARPSLLGQAIDLDRGCVDLVTATTFAQMCPQVPIPSLPFIGAYGISVRSLETVERILTQGGLPYVPHGRSLIVAFPPELGCGAWMFSRPDEASADPR
jgi:hypothetical protein